VFKDTCRSKDLKITRLANVAKGLRDESHGRQSGACISYSEASADVLNELLNGQLVVERCEKTLSTVWHERRSRSCLLSVVL
jgi:hypothetical protein